MIALTNNTQTNTQFGNLIVEAVDDGEDGEPGFNETW
jgi:hypothetical protein